MGLQGMDPAMGQCEGWGWGSSASGVHPPAVQTSLRFQVPEAPVSPKPPAQAAVSPI